VKNVAIDMSAFNAIPAGSGSSDNKSPANNSNDPTNVELKVAWTKDRLQDAPDFQYYKPPARTSSTPSPATTGAAPRPTRRAADASRPLRPGESCRRCGEFESNRRRS
jgi:hypothetical protein